MHPTSMLTCFGHVFPDLNPSYHLSYFSFSPCIPWVRINKAFTKWSGIEKSKLRSDSWTPFNWGFWTLQISECALCMLKLSPPSANCIWRQGLWGCMKVKWHHKGDLSQREVVPLWGEDETPGSSLYTHTGERPWEGTVRRWPSARQEERSHQKPTVMGLILDFDLQKCKKINFFGLSHPVCGILLWQAE